MAFGPKELKTLLNRVDELRVGVLGDFCLDVYWHADMKKSELSRETPHFPLPVVEERMQPGGAGNVACNLAALKPAQVVALSVLGQDWRGGELVRLLRAQSIDTTNLLQTTARVTNGYIKPMRHGISDTVYEDPRLDFENHKSLPAEWEEKLLRTLDEAASTLDVLCVCDQMAFGCVTPRVREAICKLGEKGLTVFVDSRDRIAEYRNVIVKPNEVELCRAMGMPPTTEEEALLGMARALRHQTERPLIVTLGANGCLVLENGGEVRVPAYQVPPPIDICGAGDTFLAAVALMSAAGASLPDAAAYGACSASLTVQKLHMTGVTTREELEARVEEMAAAK